MNQAIPLFILGFLMTLSSTAWSAEVIDDRRHWVGSSLFVLVNAFPVENPPNFYQINYGFRVTPKDSISFEAITWKYNAPLGIPFGSSFEDPDEAYPGTVQSFGVGAAYQRFLWKGFYTALHALPLLQHYRDTDEKIIQKGFQLFLTARLGYHVELFQNRFFIEPNVAVTHWPINTNVPASFARMEDHWPNYFLAEPGAHFGVNF